MAGFTEPILHVDMDAFFVEVERLDDPTLRGRPVIVGGLGPRGVVAAASYEARAYGVHSAMPMREARRRCPHASYVAPSHGTYGAVSSRVFDALHSFTPRVEALSVDEAFLDVSGLRLHYAGPVDVAVAIRARLRTELGLPASVGIAPTKFLAKLASEEAKPDGIYHVHAGDELGFLHPLPVRRLWGVGEATHAALEGLGVATIGDLAALPEGLVARRLGRALGAHLSALAHGIDRRMVESGGEAKSISVENTFDRDLTSERAIDAALLDLCHRLDARLRRSAARGHTISLKVRLDDFTTVTRSETSPDAVAHAAEFFPVVRTLWSRVDRGGSGVRLLGVAVSGLEDREAPEQMLLVDDHKGAAAAVDEIRQRFGDDAVVPGGLLWRQSGAENTGRGTANTPSP